MHCVRNFKSRLRKLGSKILKCKLRIGNCKVQTPRCKKSFYGRALFIFLHCLSLAFFFIDFRAHCFPLRNIEHMKQGVWGRHAPSETVVINRAGNQFAFVNQLQQRGASVL